MQGTGLEAGQTWSCCPFN